MNQSKLYLRRASGSDCGAVAEAVGGGGTASATGEGVRGVGGMGAEAVGGVGIGAGAIHSPTEKN